MLSQQSSLRGIRTALMCHAAIAATEAASFGPSKMPHPWMQAYSVPERLTPSKRIAVPSPLTRWLPATPIENGVAAAAVDVLTVKATRAGPKTSRSRRAPKDPMPPVSQPSRSRASRIALPDGNSETYGSTSPSVSGSWRRPVGSIPEPGVVYGLVGLEILSAEQHAPVA